MAALQYQFSKRIFAAAVRLAAVYALCVIVTFTIVLAFSRSLAMLVDILPVLGIPGAISFGAAFVLLAFARRAGFIALWLIILGLWATSMILAGDIAPGWDSAFLFWTIFAAPLYAMVMLGFRSDVTSHSPARRMAPWILGAAWLGLVIVNLRFDFHPALQSYNIWRVYLVLSFLLPLGVTTNAIRRILRTKAPASR